MITVKDLKNWIKRLKDDDLVGIEEGGLALVVCQNTKESLEQLRMFPFWDDAYIEIGGIPEEEREIKPDA